jgi:hypothetical protein
MRNKKGRKRKGREKYKGEEGDLETKLLFF